MPPYSSSIRWPGRRRESVERDAARLTVHTVKCGARAEGILDELRPGAENDLVIAVGRVDRNASLGHRPRRGRAFRLLLLAFLGLVMSSPAVEVVLLPPLPVHGPQLLAPDFV